MVQIAPSILSADFANLARDMEKAANGGAQVIHVDVMDGHFVPNLTIGPPVVHSIRNATRLPLDVHLMVEKPDTLIPAFIRSGADRISIHVEAAVHLHRSISTIKQAGIQAGVALNPGTPLGAISEILPMLNFVVIMTVNPGFGGQSFIPESLGKIKRLSNVIKSRGLNTVISVDGGVHIGNVAELVKAGAQVLVAGSSVFKTPNPEKAVRKLLEAAKAAKAAKI